MHQRFRRNKNREREPRKPNPEREDRNSLIAALFADTTSLLHKHRKLSTKSQDWQASEEPGTRNTMARSASAQRDKRYHPPRCKPRLLPMILRRNEEHIDSTVSCLLCSDRERTDTPLDSRALCSRDHNFADALLSVSCCGCIRIGRAFATLRTEQQSPDILHTGQNAVP